MPIATFGAAERMRLHRVVSISLALLFAIGSSQAVRAQQRVPVDFTQVTRPVVEVTDSATIDFLLFELFVEPLELPTRLQVIDVTQNGFGPDDILIAYPSAEAFLISEFLPDAVQMIMSGWQPEVEYRMDSGNMPTSALAALVGSEPDSTKRAQSAILYDLVEAVDRSYRDLPVAVLFQRDSVGFTFQLWDYNLEAMHYTPRPAFVVDSAVTAVLAMLEDVGYVPGQNVVGLGLSLESQGTSVATVERALLGITRLSDEQMRSMAVRTVLLGSYDLDRSGAIDRAREIDAPPCEVWNVLEDAFPGFLDQFGFSDPEAPYLGNIVFDIAPSVRAPANRRGAACLRGEEPPPTDPAEVAAAVDESDLPEPVDRFVELTTGAEIVRRAGSYPAGSADWSRDVRTVLLDRFDADDSGLLDRATEVRSISCDVWQAIAATHPDFQDELGSPTSDAYVGDRIGFAPSQRDEVLSRSGPCIESTTETASLRLRAAQPRESQLPSETIRAAVTIPLRGLGGVPDEERRYLPAKTVLLAMFDLDRSGYVDRAAELDAIPCEVWAALDVTFPGFAERYGFVNPSPSAPYRGSIVFNISERLQAPAERRIAACEDGETPPSTSSAEVDPQWSGEIILPAQLKDFLDLETAAVVAQSATGMQPGSAEWAATVQSVLVGHYDLDRSGLLDQPDELDEVPCVVWNTIEATYGGPLSGLLLGDEDQFMGDEVGVSFAQRRYATARIRSCRD